ncbi:universal stress protein [Arthrobacter sp. SIMBA_036]|uniref:universal stress protein n=1 Tax=Arthrobacter sp. SIMBA_036 TaxID=3085778 RepID=UPI00397DE339
MTEPPASSSPTLNGPVVVGVMPGQRPAVVEQAARLAASAGLALVFAYADVTVYPVDGTLGGPAAPIDPDGVDDVAAGFPESLADDLRRQLAPFGVPWSTVLLAGEPAHALAREAANVGASMIVVGTRGHRLSATLKDLAGSVARQLLRRQDRPVLVVPVDSRGADRHDEH